MLFNSFSFIVFLPLVIMAYYLITPRFRWMMLLAVSYYFYMCWNPKYIILILLSTLVDYYAGIKMAQQKEQKDRRKFMALSLIINLGLLFFFKYYNFFNYNIEVLFSHFNVFYHSPTFDLLLPVGISFYTFQTLSYSFDVYKGKCSAEKHFGYFALYVSYFPQLVAGPIERAPNLIPQLRGDNKLRYEDFRYGINKILLGFFKKVVVADTLSIYVNQVYADPANSTGIRLIIASVFFVFQIFCDFSGYTDIAMGSARLMGVRLMENFDRPFWVTSISEFWSKWHISLTSWIGDYIFKPLLRMKKTTAAVNTIFVFVIIGFWHGARWTFIFFGLYHGVLIILQRIYKSTGWFNKFNKSSAGDLTLRGWNFILFTLSTVLFRSQNIHQALIIYKKFFTDVTISMGEIFALYKAELLQGLLVLALLSLTILFNRKLRFKYNWLYITFMIFVIMMLGQDLKNQFIYFQF